MTAGDGDLGLVFPAAAKLPHFADQDRARLGIHEQFWNVVLRHPFGVSLDNGDDVSRLATNRNLARPGQRRPAVFATEERLAIHRHLRVWQLAQHRSRQHALDEQVAIKDHRLTVFWAEALKHRRRRLAPFVPSSHWPHDAFHVGDAAHPVAMLVGPVEPERRAPVVDHQQNFLARPDHRIDERQRWSRWVVKR